MKQAFYWEVTVQNLIAWNLCTPTLAIVKRPIGRLWRIYSAFCIGHSVGVHSNLILSLPVFETQRAIQWQCVNASGPIMSLGEDFIVFWLFIVSFLQFVELGVVTSIESNHKTVESARKGQEVCIKIEPIPGEAPKMFGRHFDEKDFLVSKVRLL